MHILKAFGIYDRIALQKDLILLYDLQQHGQDPRYAVSLKMKRCISLALCVLAWPSTFVLAEVLEVARGPVFPCVESGWAVMVEGGARDP